MATLWLMDWLIDYPDLESGRLRWDPIFLCVRGRWGGSWKRWSMWVLLLGPNGIARSGWRTISSLLRLGIIRRMICPYYHCMWGKWRRWDGRGFKWTRQDGLSFSS